MTTPEEHEWSRSAPGTEAFKQDYAAWQSLAADVAKALERAEGVGRRPPVERAREGSAPRRRQRARARRLSRTRSQYFESIATIKQTGKMTFGNPLPPWALPAVVAAAHARRVAGLPATSRLPQRAAGCSSALRFATLPVARRSA